MSSALSRIFLWLFVLMLIPAAANIISQVLQKPLRVNIGPGAYMSLGEPGIVVGARKNSSIDYPAPDTLINLTIVHADSVQRRGAAYAGGSFHLNASPAWDTKAMLDSTIARETSKGNSVQLDTSLVVIKHLTWDMDEYEATTSFDSLPDGRVVYLNTGYDKNGREIPPRVRDTFANMREAQIYSITNTKKEPAIIREEPTATATDQLRILPADTGQRLAFAVYQGLSSTGIAVLFFLVSRLFRNFSKEDYFTLANVKYLRNLGACLLAVQLVKALFYFVVLVKIHPIKIMAGGFDKTVSRVCQYEIKSGVEPQDIFLGIGILVLSYIFLNGLKLKQEQALTI